MRRSGSGLGRVRNYLSSLVAERSMEKSEKRKGKRVLQMFWNQLKALLEVGLSSDDCAVGESKGPAA